MPQSYELVSEAPKFFEYFMGNYFVLFLKIAIFAEF